ncbi:MAG: DNA/RNA non-specific endonuclease [Gemmatimonadetes bacterium]|nr:DNA/RNA non-specific endonuclease [Gemmatimonadota bacterium]
MLRTALRFPRPAAAAALLALVASCTEPPTHTAAETQAAFSSAQSLPPVRISEFHYDNVSTDVGEAIEISAPAGTDLSGWRIVRYNGSTPTAAVIYTTPAPTTVQPFPTGTIVADQCSGRGTVVVNYPTNGLQNGTADGFALVDNTGTIVELWSYAGSFTVAAGQTPGAGMVAVDVGVTESNASTPVGHSLQRNSSGVWSAPAANTFGACNDNGVVTPPAVVTSVRVTPTSAQVNAGSSTAFTAEALDASNVVIPGKSFTWSSADPSIATVNASGVATGQQVGTTQIRATVDGVTGSATLTVNAPPGVPTVRFTEIHYDNSSTDVNEKIEIEGPAGTDLTGWSVVLYNGNGGAPYDVKSLSGLIPNTCSGRGVVVVDYAQDGIQNGAPDGFALVQADNSVVEFLSYEGTMTATGGAAVGTSSTDIGVAEVSSTPYGFSLQRNAAGTAWNAPALSTFGGCSSGGPVPPQPGSITFTGRVASDPALPIGFQDQIFATVRDAVGTVIVDQITWTTDTPALASIDATGVMTSFATGTAIFRATGVNSGATGTYPLAMGVPVASATAVYGNHAEFGEPADGTPADDFILRRTGYTSSFNPLRNIPNWVSYNLDASHFGAEDRCDCFTYDPLLPPQFTRYTTADFTGAGAYHGYGIDRGHLARSADRTGGSLDNALTYYFSNIIPQAADNNQGPWAQFESFLGDLARVSNKELYIIAGASGSKGTLKDLGVITIPAQTWKVAVVMSRDEGLAQVTNRNNVEVYAVILPNDAGIQNVPWQTYLTTVDAVEALSGYDLLALLPDAIEAQVERGNRFPTAVLNGPFSATEGAAIAMSGASSSDPDAGATLTYAWNFGDGTAATGASVNKTYAQNGNYTVTLTVTDQFGAAHTTTSTATITNVAPTPIVTVPGSWKKGVAGTVGVRFTDPGTRDAAWTVRINWGDGSAVTQFSSLTIPATPLTRTKSYAAPGQYTITVTVTDKDGGTGTYTTLITVTP